MEHAIQISFSIYIYIYILFTNLIYTYIQSNILTTLKLQFLTDYFLFIYFFQNATHVLTQLKYAPNIVKEPLSFNFLEYFWTIATIQPMTNKDVLQNKETHPMYEKGFTSGAVMQSWRWDRSFPDKETQHTMCITDFRFENKNQPTTTSVIFIQIRLKTPFLSFSLSLSLSTSYHNIISYHNMQVRKYHTFWTFWQNANFFYSFIIPSTHKQIILVSFHRVALM